MPTEQTITIPVHTTDTRTFRKIDVIVGDKLPPTPLFFAQKTPDELRASLAIREKKLGDGSLGLEDQDRYRKEIPIIKARALELDRLSHTQNPKSIQEGIDTRNAELKKIVPDSKDAPKIQKRLTVEIDALVTAKARLFFGQKSLPELTSSLVFRQKALSDSSLSTPDRQRFEREIPLIREMLQNKDPKQARTSLTLRAAVKYSSVDTTPSQDFTATRTYETGIRAVVTYSGETDPDANPRSPVESTPTSSLIKARVRYVDSVSSTGHENDTSQETTPVLMTAFERVKDVSPTLKANPEAVLDEKAEVDRYFSLHGRAYMNQLRQLDAQIEKPMNPNCRVAVCIPAYHEEKNIYRTLLNYTKQTGLPLDQLEVLILDNHREGKMKDGTEREVRRFQKEHPELAISYMHATFPEQFSSMGNIRKVSQDIALYRSQMRSIKTKGDLIIASNDADSYGFRSNAFSWLVNEFDKNRNADLIVGKYSYPEEAFIKFPILRSIFMVDKSLRALNESLMRRSQGKSQPSIFSSGANSYYRASVYTAIGGYDSRIMRGSDVNVGNRIATIRTDKEKHIIYSNAPKALVDPRRALSKMMSGYHWINEWDDKVWQENPNVIGKSWKDFSDKDLEVFTKTRFETEVNAWFRLRLDQAKKQRPQVKEADLARWMKPKLERVFGTLGVKIEVKPEKITIVDTTKLENRLYKQTDISEPIPSELMHVPRPSPLSETLTSNPEAKLDDKKETLRYLTTLPPEYIDELEGLNRQIPNQMSPECTMAICIPARSEEKSIYRTLLQYAKQKNLDPKSYEIYIFVAKDQENPRANDAMLSEVTRFQKNHANVPVHYLYADFGTNNTYLGQNAKVMTDLALLRRSKIPWNNEQFIVVRNDADAWNIRDTGFRAMRDKFTHETDLDVMFGKYDFPIESYRQFPVFHAFTLFHRGERRIRSRNFVVNDKRGPIPPHASGGSTYMRAGIYAAVGGYNKSVGPEDSEILDRIRSSRSRHDKHIHWSNAVNLKTDPRRPLGFMTTGHHFIDQWNRSIMALRDPRVAGKTWQEFSDPRLEILSRGRLEEEINAFISTQKITTRNQSYYLSRAIPAFKRIISAIGIDAEVHPDGRIILNNIENLQTALRDSMWGKVHDRTMLELQKNKLIGYRQIFKPDSEDRQTLERDIAYFESRLSSE